MRALLKPLLSLLLVLLAQTASAELVVVSGAKSGIDHLSRQDVVFLFMGRLRQLPTGVPAVPVDLAVDSEIQEFPVLAGDTYLLCSDGLSDMLADEEIGQVLCRRREDPATAADKLVQMANACGRGGPAQLDRNSVFLSGLSAG